MIINSWDYLDEIDTMAFTHDMGDYLIVGDKTNERKYLINKSKVKFFSNNEDKLQFRLSLFNSLRDHAHYGKWFATEKRKGLLFAPMIKFIEDFLSATIDLDNNKFAVAQRNCLLNGSMEQLGKNRLQVDEILAVIQGLIRREEEGIVDIVGSMTEEDYPRLINC